MERLILLFLIMAATGSISAQDVEINSPLAYTIVPTAEKATVKLDIEVSFKTTTDSTMTINLPRDYYGTPDIHRFVESVDGLEQTKVRWEKGFPDLTVQPNIDNEVRLKYSLRYVPDSLKGYAFAPNVCKDRFDVAGCQWLLQIGNLSQEYEYHFTISDAPENWNFYSTLSANPLETTITTSYEDLISSAMGGGSQAYRKILIQDQPVEIFMADEIQLPSDSLFDAVEEVMREQRGWFNDFDFPFYHVSIMPKEGVVAGTAVDNMFICFVREDIEADKLNLLLAHENFHTWLPNKIYVHPGKGEYNFKYEWLYEGFTDYLARKILRDAGFLSQDKFVELINQDIINQAENPANADTYEQLKEKARNRQFRSAEKKLAYYKGALIALRWDDQIRKNGKGGLKDLITALYEEAKKQEGEIDEKTFFEVSGQFGIDAKKTLNTHIIEGKPVQVNRNVLPGYVLQDTTIAAYDPGFNLRETWTTRKISGVDPKGPAYKAGLRNGMKYVSIDNANRFGNNWQRSKPMTVTVEDEQGVRESFTFMPSNGSLDLKLFQKAN